MCRSGKSSRFSQRKVTISLVLRLQKKNRQSHLRHPHHLRPIPSQNHRQQPFPSRPFPHRIFPTRGLYSLPFTDCCTSITLRHHRISREPESAACSLKAIFLLTSAKPLVHLEHTKSLKGKRRNRKRNQSPRYEISILENGFFLMLTTHAATRRTCYSAAHCFYDAPELSCGESCST